MGMTGSALLDVAATNRNHDSRTPTIRGRTPSFLHWFERDVTAVWVIVAIIVGALHAAYFRYFMNPDGVAYLDMGDAYLRGDWISAIRSHWSPLYAWLLAGVVRIVQPPPGIEFPVVHLVNLAIYAAALGTFTFLLRQIEATLDDPNGTGRPAVGLPLWAWRSLCYAVFLWCTLRYGLL